MLLLTLPQSDGYGQPEMSEEHPDPGFVALEQQLQDARSHIAAMRARGDELLASASAMRQRTYAAERALLAFTPGPMAGASDIVVRDMLLLLSSTYLYWPQTARLRSLLGAEHFPGFGPIWQALCDVGHQPDHKRPGAIVEKVLTRWPGSSGDVIWDFLSRLAVIPFHTPNAGPAHGWQAERGAVKRVQLAYRAAQLTDEIQARYARKIELSLHG